MGSKNNAHNVISSRRYRRHGLEDHIYSHTVDGSHGLTLRAILPKATRNVEQLRLRGRPRMLQCPLCLNVSKSGKARDPETGLCLSQRACERRQSELPPDQIGA